MWVFLRQIKSNSRLCATSINNHLTRALFTPLCESAYDSSHSCHCASIGCSDVAASIARSSVVRS